jgi:hypothetical protein
MVGKNYYFNRREECNGVKATDMIKNLRKRINVCPSPKYYFLEVNLDMLYGDLNFP